MSISASQVKELREMSGVGMMECKKALVETNGDLQQALDLLRANSSLKAEKARLQKEIADIKAKAAKEKKIGNWDEKSDRLSQVNEQLVQNKCK